MGGEEPWTFGGMNEQISQANEQPEESLPIHVLHRDLSTRNQVGVLLAIVNSMTGFISRDPREAENIPGSKAISGEAKAAAEVTLMAACAQLDRILEDERRWGIDYQLSLEKLFNTNSALARELAEKQKALLESELSRAKAQERAAREAASPHFQYRPSLIKLTDGTWAAFLGDLSNLDNSIAGVGASPTEALASFDLAFGEPMTEATLQILQRRKRELTQQHSQAEHTKHEYKLDRERQENPGDDVTPGAEPFGDSETPGPKL